MASRRSSFWDSTDKYRPRWRKEDKIVAKTAKRAGAVKKVADKKGAKPSNPISRYLRETRGELRKVTWPTREESWRLTLIVLAVSIIMSIFLWVFDSLFSNSIQFALEQIIGL